MEIFNVFIRQYLPKGIAFNIVAKGQIAKAEWLLNNRPSIVLDGQSLAGVLH